VLGNAHFEALGDAPARSMKSSAAAGGVSSVAAASKISSQRSKCAASTGSFWCACMGLPL